MQSYDGSIGTTLYPLFVWLYEQIPLQYLGGGGGYIPINYNVWMWAILSQMRTYDEPG